MDRSRYGPRRHLPSRRSCLIHGQVMRAALMQAVCSRLSPIRRGLITQTAPPALLVEAAADQVLLRSSEIDNASWTKRGTASVTANAIVGPDGATTGDQITVGFFSLNDIFQGGRSIAAGSATPSLYIRRVSTSGILRVTNSQTNAAGEIRVDLSALPDAWTRVHPSHPAVTVINAWSDSSLLIGMQFAAVSGDITLNVWGCDIKSGSVMSSHVPTTTATVTRPADTLSAAAFGSNPAIIQVRTLAGVQSRKIINPWSGVLSETNEWIESAAIYPLGTPTSFLNTRLTVNGPW
jgi:hypothetical protein